jgi:hypothetical protein
MIESFELIGQWWLPGDTDNLLSGILRFDPINGIKLELIGSFEKKFPTKTRLEYDIILGVISRKQVTLHICNEREHNFGAPGFQKYIFKVNTLFLGHHFNKIEDINFKSLTIRYTNLYDWVGKSGYNKDVKFDSDNKFKTYSLEIESPDKIELDLDEFQIVIEHRFNVNENSSKINLEEYDVIEIIPNESSTLDDLRDNICYHLQNFLSLGIGSAISPLSITGECEDCKVKYPDGKIIDKSIEIYYAVKNPILAEKKIYPHEMFFSLSDIAEYLEEALKNWFGKAEDLKPVYDLYFGTLNNSSMYLEHSFMSLIQALESYHRRTYEGNYLPKDQYSKVRDVLIMNIPDFVAEDHRESLESRIHFGNEFSLKTRLTAIFEDFGEIFSSLIEDQDEFIKDVKNTRNYYTHYDESLKRKAKTGQDLFILTEKLKFIIEICFLKELGLPSDKIEKITSENSRYDYILSLEK